MKQLSFLLIVLALFVSCDNYNTQKEVDAVFNVHDEVMPKMGEVMNLKRKVLEKAGDATDSTEVNELRALAKELDDANTGMMVWMREWSKVAEPHIKEQTTVEERKAFFKEEMTKVVQVKEDINKAIAAAEKILK